MSNYRQCIHIEGKCIEDIFRLPCVYCVEKTFNGNLFVRLYPDMVAIGSSIYALKGQWLCEDYDGIWHVQNKL